MYPKASFLAILLLLGGFNPISAIAKTTSPQAQVVRTKVVQKVAPKAVKVIKTSAAKADVHIASDKTAPSKKGSVASVSPSAVTKPAANCMKAIKKANVFCQKIGRGCLSQSTSAKCVTANQKCEVEQQAALALCPAV